MSLNSKRRRTVSDKRQARKKEESRSIPYAWILAGVVILLNWNTLGNSFTLDDRTLVLEDSRTSSLSDIGDIFSGGYRTNAANSLYRPLTVLSLAVNRALLGENPGGYHAVNLLLHLMAVLLVFRLSLEVFPTRSWAFWAAMFFAAHPIHVEAVANVVGRAELMSGICVLGGLILLVKNREKDLRSSLPSYAGATVLYAAGLLSKESAAVFVGLWALFSFYHCNAGLNLVTRLRTIISDYRIWGLVLVSFGYFGVRYLVLGPAAAFALQGTTYVENPLAFVGVQERILTAIHVLARYIWLMIWPFKLSPDYSFHAVPLISRAGNPTFLMSATLLAGLGICALVLARKKPVYLLSYVFFLVSISIVSNLVIPIGATMAERFLYLPSVAFCWTLTAVAYDAGIMARGSDANVRRRLAFGTMILLVVSWGCKTVLRNREWRNDRTLFEAALVTTPRSAKVHTIMGDIHYRDQNFNKAEQEYRLALDISPDSAAAAINLAAALDALERHEESVALLERFAGKSGNLEAGRLHELAVANMGLQRYLQAAEAYESLLRLNEKDALAHRNLGGLYIQFLSRLDEGRMHIRRSLELAPGQPGSDQMRSLLQSGLQPSPGRE